MQNIKEICDTMRRPNPRIIGIEGEDSDLQTQKIFSTKLKRKFPQLKERYA